MKINKKKKGNENENERVKFKNLINKEKKEGY